MSEEIAGRAKAPETNQARAWWVLVGVTVLLGLFGIGDLLSGPANDPQIALGITGLTLAEIEAADPVGSRLYDIQARIGGAGSIALGMLMTAILVFAYRTGQRWAWWVMWTLPAFAVFAYVFFAGLGVAAGQSPPPPMVSGPPLAVITAAALLFDAPVFFRDRRATGGQP